MKNLVTKEEIIDVAKLMKIELEDHSQHMKRVQKMLEYFDILDKANIESDEIIGSITFCIRLPNRYKKR